MMSFRNSNMVFQIMMQKINQYVKYAPSVLRYGLALVYLAFGIYQFVDPYNFVGYLPDMLFNSPYRVYFVYANALFEILFGSLLLLGLFTRFVSFLLALHLAIITVELWFSIDAIRDFGLAVATFAVWLRGEDELCLSKKFKRFK
jgi:uncharacterized membrane protein YphA (DoxX/SURF4 family)